MPTVFYSSLLTVLILACTLPACSQSKKQNQPSTDSLKKTMTATTAPKMKVEIWSDIMCPFCYIGKRHYEEALRQFPDSNHIEIEWHSFQLDPTIPKEAQKTDVYQYLAERKGMSVAQSRSMHDNVVAMAKSAGLTYNFDKAVVANSFDAHRVIQLAKTKGLGDEIEERLFKAYFTEGQDFSNHETLVKLGHEVGLAEADIREVLNSNRFTTEVKQDIAEAGSIGVQGVPFFVFDRKFAVSGAQPSQAFLETLKKSFAGWRKSNPVLEHVVSDGPVCTPDGECK
jgi:protein disulfide-isomerase